MWLQHLRPEVARIIFPRDVGQWRTKVFNEEQYIAWVKDHYGLDNCFTAVFSDFQRSHNLYDTIFIDVDLVDNFVWKAQKILLKLMGRNIVPRTNFTAGKGFHVWVDFGLMKFKNYSTTVLTFLDEVGVLKHIRKKDRCCVAETSRLCRIPLTPHPKTGLMSYRMESSMLFSTELNKIKRLGLCGGYHYDEPYLLNDAVSKRLWEIDQQTPIKQYDYREIQDGTVDLPLYPKCISMAIKEFKDSGGLDHYRRLHLIWFMWFIGLSKEDIQAIFKEYASDYKPQLTSYQINRSFNRHLHPYRCDKAALLGVCPLSDKSRKNCGYYPSIVWAVKRAERGRLNAISS